MDNFSTWEIFSPTVFNTVNSWITFGSTNKEVYQRLDYAAGLNIELTQTTYKVHICMNNIKTSGNTAKQSGLYGNLHIVIENWMCHCSVIRAEHIVSTNTGGKCDFLRLNYGNSSLCTSTCPSKEIYMVHISDSHFVGSGIRVAADKSYCDTWIDLQSITVQNCTKCITLLVKNMISIKLQNMRFIYNLKGITISNSNMTFYGNNSFAHNIGRSHILALANTIISFHGDTTIIANKVEWGGAILAISNIPTNCRISGE